MPRISSLITKGFNTPYVVPGYWRIPVGALIMYSGASDPGLAGWTRYTAADGKFIKGTATQSEIGTVTANNNATLTTGSTSTGTAGYHSFPSTTTKEYGVANPQNTTVFTYQLGAGDHAHTLFFSLGSGNDLNPASTDYILLQATETKRYFPANAVLSKSTQITGSTQQLATGDFRYIRGGSTYANTAATTRTISGSTDSQGTHSHGPSSYIGSTFATGTSGLANIAENSISGLGHSHTISGTVSGSRLIGNILKLWKLSTQIAAEDNIIIMYTGTIANLPSYWKVCDGTNGTPNMAGLFLGYSNIANTAHGTYTPYSTPSSLGGLSTNTWTHQHTGGQSTRSGTSTSYLHASTSVSHSHTFSNPSIATFQPDEIKLCFIQLTQTLY
jgi:hypothetical protein